MSAYPGIRMASAGASAPTLVSPRADATWQASPAYALGLICTVSNGASLTYSVQVTADQVPSATGNWNDHEMVSGQTGSINSNVAYPVTAVRLNVTAYTSGSVNLGVAQWP